MSLLGGGLFGRSFRSSAFGSDFFGWNFRFRSFGSGYFPDTRLSLFFLFFRSLGSLFFLFQLAFGQPLCNGADNGIQHYGMMWWEG